MTEERQTWTVWECGNDLRQAIVAQALVLLVTSLILDGGLLRQATVICIIAHWLLVALMLIRRPKALTKTDKVLMQCGFVVFSLILLVVAIVPAVLAPR